MFIDLIRSRRSIRKFQNRPVEPEKIDLLMETALRAPSSRDLNPWCFVIVTDREMMAALSKAKPHGASFLAKAPLAMVVCADPAKSDVWVEDAAIAAIYIHLAACDLGLGSCWIQLRKRFYNADQSSGDYVSGLLGLPKEMEVEAIIAIGYPGEEKAPHPKSGLPFDRINRERYGKTH